MDLFLNLKDESHMSITPSNPNTFFMHNNKSTLSCTLNSAYNKVAFNEESAITKE